ncbi:MAG: acyltransferase [Burkholderiaceae bacterium]
MLKPEQKLYVLVSLRGIAAWLIVLFHSKELIQPPLPHILDTIVRHGYLAVDLFFVLSGFIIYLNYASKFKVACPKEMVNFYWNRFTRIYPVHFVVLCAYAFFIQAFLLFSNSGKIPESFTRRGLVESLLLIQTWLGHTASWNVPSWSISAEWFVYLWFPLIAVQLAARIKTLAAHLLALAVFFSAIFSIYYGLHLESLGGAITSLALVRAMLEFSCGTLVGSLFLNHHDFLVRVRIPAAAGAVLAGLCVAAFRLPDYAFSPLIFSVLIGLSSVDRSMFSRMLSNKILVYLGEISYSTYMVHYLVYELLKATVIKDLMQVNQVYLYFSFLVVLVLSMGMHRFVEVPAQSWLRSKVQLRTFKKPISSGEEPL